VWRDTSRPPRIDAVAVLPLADPSGDATQRLVADSLTEEVISALARIESLRVISRTSMQRYRDRNRSVGQRPPEVHDRAMTKP
jgi:TolB-like protein